MCTNGLLSNTDGVFAPYNPGSNQNIVNTRVVVTASQHQPHTVIEQ